jgi:TnpA family transposase
MLKRLSAYPRQNGLAVALREIGRIERSLFTLDWIRDPALRRRANAGLNKGEARKRVSARDLLPPPGRTTGPLV